jgi:cytochrome c peroxidase
MESGPILFDIGTATDDAHVMIGTFFESLLPDTEARLFRELRGDRDLGEGDWVQTVLDFRQRPSRARGQFKAPSLVNVWENAVFFHDGRFDSLDEVVGFFDGYLSLGLPRSAHALAPTVQSARPRGDRFGA